MNEAYDIIGDIHGQAGELERLLERLGYTALNGVYSHPERTAIFLGDFIDRGLQQRRVLEIVKPMVESGVALAVMGNHEYNAIAFATEHNGQYLRRHTANNVWQHGAFLDAYKHDSNGREAAIEWFKTLPLWLELPKLRVIHACWDGKNIDRLIEEYQGSSLTPELLINSSQKRTWEYEAIETLLKGKEIDLPPGHSFEDKDEIRRHAIRVKWWQAASTYRTAYIGPPLAESQIPDDPIKGDHLIEYSEEDKPVFIGHYWLTGAPAPLAKNIACVDYSVAKAGGSLVAYRFDGEKELTASKFVAVERIEC